ncbi:hypothetical protein [Streptomyces sp. NPDC055134]
MLGIARLQNLKLAGQAAGSDGSRPPRPEHVKDHLRDNSSA